MKHIDYAKKRPEKVKKKTRFGRFLLIFLLVALIAFFVARSARTQPYFNRQAPRLLAVHAKPEAVKQTITVPIHFDFHPLLPSQT